MLINISSYQYTINFYSVIKAVLSINKKQMLIIEKIFYHILNKLRFNYN